MTIWIVFITVYLLGFGERALLYSVTESAHLLSQAKSKKIKAYYYFRLIGVNLFWPLKSLFVCLHILIGIITREKQEEPDDEDLP